MRLNQCLLVALVLACSTLTAEAGRTFVHPGIPLTRADLDGIKQNLTREPWKSAFAELAADKRSSLNYKPRGPFEELSRTPDMSAPYLTSYRDRRGENMESFVFRKTRDADRSTPAPSLPSPAPTASVTSGLRDVDIGGAKAVARSTYDNGVWTVRGGGRDLWNQPRDSFHFAYRAVRGDFTMIAKLVGLEASNPDARIGLVARDTLAPDAKRRAYIGLQPTTKPTNMIETSLRGFTASSHNRGEERTHDGVVLPQWFKIQRVGTRLTLFHSLEGANWTAGQNAEFAGWNGDAFIGLAVCSRDDTTATARFTDVRVTGGDGRGPTQKPEPPFAIYGSPGDGQVTLRWLESYGATEYVVHRAIPPDGASSVVATVKGTGCIDMNVKNGTAYRYVVTARNTVGESDSSKEDVVTPGLTPAVNLPPAAKRK